MATHDATMTPTIGGADTLTQLLKVEVAAVASYDHAAAEFAGQPAAAALNHIRDDHRAAAEILQKLLGCSEEQPSAGCGAFADAAAHSAREIGPATVLHALRLGEEHGIGEYEMALSDTRLVAVCKDVIRSELLPRCQAHVLDLDHMMAGK